MGNGITLSVRLQYVSFSLFNFIPEIDEKENEKTERFIIEWGGGLFCK